MISFSVTDNSTKNEKEIEIEIDPEETQETELFADSENGELDVDNLKKEVAKLILEVGQKNEEISYLNKRVRQSMADSAEYEQSCKRRIKEVEESSMQLSQVIEVYDFFRMGLDASAASPEVHQGMKMAYDACLELLRRKGIQLIEPKKGDNFDPSIHKVIGTASSDEIDSGCVLSARPGYAIFENGAVKKTIKHSEVVLSKSEDTESFESV